MTEIEALRARHSVRKYQARPLETDAREALEKEIARLNAAGDLNMQLVTDEPKAFKGFLAYGSFANVTDYVMVIGRKSESLDYRAGYYGEALVLFAQSIGLNTCFVGLTYKKVSGAFEVKEDEKVVLCIAVGYGEPDGYRTHKIKSSGQVSNVSVDSPDWFRQGVDAALLAPTAINQQKFYFEYLPEKDAVQPRKGTSLAGYTKIDLGIAMYNFEVGAGRPVTWIPDPRK